MTESYPTPYRISTITATGSIGTNINLDILYDCLVINDSNNSNNSNSSLSNLMYIEYGKKKSETIFKGQTKKSLTRRVKEPKKRFDNQVTIVFAMETFNCTLNMKIFKNGNIQITGIKDVENGARSIDLLVDIINDIYKKQNKSIVTDIKALKNENYKIRLINTDYKVGFVLKRDVLHRLIKTELGLICNYEPVIYPGVKIHYFYNVINKKKGICECPIHCGNKKSGEGDGLNSCKKITVAIFQSGCIIITGSQSIEQIKECYNYINNILFKYRPLIEKDNIKPQLGKSNLGKKVLVLKSSIIY